MVNARHSISRELSRQLAAMSFICTCLVVFLHSYTTGIVNGRADVVVLNANTFVQEFVSQGICRVAVPFFFFSFGLLLFRDYEPSWEWTKRKWGRRIRSLLIPYLLWCVFGSLFIYTLNFFHALAYNRSLSELGFSPGSLVWWDGLFGVSCFPVKMYHLWFVKVLLIYVALAPALGYMLAHTAWAVPCGALLLYAWPDTPHWLAMSLLFISCGACVSIHGNPEVLCQRPSGWAVAGLLLSWMGLCACKALMTLHEVANERIFHLGQVGILVGVVALWLAVGVVAWPEFLRRQFFFVYCMHFPFYGYIGAVMKRMPFSSPLLYWFLVPLCNLCLCLATAFLLKRHAPVIYKLLSGGR
jgi:hypothetical protein